LNYFRLGKNWRLWDHEIEQVFVNAFFSHAVGENCVLNPHEFAAAAISGGGLV